MDFLGLSRWTYSAGKKKNLRKNTTSNTVLFPFREGGKEQLKKRIMVIKII